MKKLFSYIHPAFLFPKLNSIHCSKNQNCIANYSRVESNCIVKHKIFF